jgi:hypothetical protein
MESLSLGSLAVRSCGTFTDPNPPVSPDQRTCSLALELVVLPLARLHWSNGDFLFQCTVRDVRPDVVVHPLQTWVGSDPQFQHRNLELGSP